MIDSFCFGAVGVVGVVGMTGIVGKVCRSRGTK